jgi:DNA-binding MarR family transcriptional regulator
MAEKEARARRGNTANLRERQQKKQLRAKENFPPLSISIEDLLTDGSDREFRHLIYSLVGFAELIIRHRSYYGAYIGVTGPQYVMMTIIAGTECTTVSHIAEQMNVSSQFVTTEIGKLIKRNIVEKKPNEADGRSMFLTLTHKGQSLLRELGPLRRKSNDRMYRSLTRDRARTLQEIMDTLLPDAKNALHELDAPHLRSEKAPTASAEMAHREGPSALARTQAAQFSRR